MASKQAFTFIGRQAHQIDCTLLRQDNGSDAVCFIFPGSGYTVNHPVLYYPGLVMLQNGIDVVQVNYSYNAISEFSAQDDAGRIQWICEDMSELVDVFLQEHTYKSHIFLGKSLGTLPMVNAFCDDPRFADALFVVQTPLLQLEDVYLNLQKLRQTTQVIIGDADPIFDQVKIRTLQANPNVELLVLDKADHRLEVENDVLQSAAVLESVTRGIYEFIKNR